MKKKLTKKDYIVLVSFVIGSIFAMYYSSILQAQYQSQGATQVNNTVPIGAKPAYYDLKFCENNGTCHDIPNGTFNTLVPQK